MPPIPAASSVHTMIAFLASFAPETTYSVTQTGISLGATIAVVCSWQRNRSILWAVVAGFLTWFYVIYFAITRAPDEVK